MSRSRKNIRENQALAKTSNSKKGNIKSRRSRRVGIILADIQLFLTFVFSGLIFLLNVLPLKYFIALVVILLFFVGYSFLSQLTKRYRSLGKVVSIFMSIVLIFGSYYIIEAKSMLSSITGKETKTDDMSIIVLKDDIAETINDAIDYTFGISEVDDQDNTKEAISNINKELNTQIDVEVFPDFDSLVEGLYEGDAEAIIMNEAYRDQIQETHPEFNDKTRVLANYEVETEIVIQTGKDKKITKEPFTVYISGIDTDGDISKSGRSDVNIIATINPSTKQVLLTNTPRDYYIPFPNTNGERDKLTHAANFGIDISMGALEDLYGIEIDYYVRVNFTTLINLVDILGGVTAYSQYDFNIGGYSFHKGNNTLNGEQALAFSRERKSLPGGDMQRGKNQMEVIKGIANKALSPAILKNYSSIMDSLSGSFETSMSSKDITSLVKMQMDDTASWNIVSSNASGTPELKTTYTYKSRKLSVIIPDEESVFKAKEKMSETFSGTVVSQE